MMNCSSSMTCLTDIPQGRLMWRAPLAPGFWGFCLSGNTKDALEVSSKTLWPQKKQQKTADRITDTQASGYDRCHDGQEFVTHGWPCKQVMGCDGPMLSWNSTRPASSRHGVVAVSGAPTTADQETAFYALMRHTTELKGFATHG